MLGGDRLTPVAGLSTCPEPRHPRQIVLEQVAQPEVCAVLVPVSRAYVQWGHQQARSGQHRCRPVQQNQVPCGAATRVRDRDACLAEPGRSHPAPTRVCQGQRGRGRAGQRTPSLWSFKRVGGGEGHSGNDHRWPTVVEEGTLRGAGWMAAALGRRWEGLPVQEEGTQVRRRWGDTAVGTRGTLPLPPGSTLQCGRRPLTFARPLTRSVACTDWSDTLGYAASPAPHEALISTRDQLGTAR